jgi:predicted secreted protein
VPVKAREVLLVAASVVAPSVAVEAAGEVDDPSAGAVDGEVDDPSAGEVITAGQVFMLLQVTTLVAVCALAVAALPSAAADSTPTNIASLIRVFFTLGSFHRMIVQYDHSQRLCKQEGPLAASTLLQLRLSPPRAALKVLSVVFSSTFSGFTNAQCALWCH